MTDQNTQKDDLQIDVSEIKTKVKNAYHFFRSRASWLLPLAFILIAMCFAIVFRLQPTYLPITDTWAENSVNNYYQNQVLQQINSQFPDLSDATKQSLAQKNYNEYIAKNSAQIQEQVKTVSQQYKDVFKRSDGQTYILDLDSYTFYQNVENYVNNGHFGTHIVNETPYTDRNAPQGLPATNGSFHEYLLIILYYFMHALFKTDLMQSLFYFAIILAPLTVIPAFFIAKRISNSNIGGFIAALLIATHQGIISRTGGGAIDTDIYTILFPLYFMWMFIETLHAIDLKKKLTYAVLTSITAAFYALAWSGWWYVFDIAIGTLITIIIIEIAKCGLFSRCDGAGLGNKIFLHIKNEVYALATLFISTFVFMTGVHFASWRDITAGLMKFKFFIMGPIGFLNLKAVAVTSTWPNIMTTVAELNPSSLDNVLSGVGGTIYFIIAILAMAILVYKDFHNMFIKKTDSRHYQFSLLFLLWIIATLYPAITAVRFLLVVTTPIVLLIGIFFGLFDKALEHYFDTTVKKSICKIAILLIALLTINPLVKVGYAVAQQEIPLMNDMWYDSLTYVKANTPNNTIMTSWWDYGYFFTAIADRPITFDGGWQTDWGAHWIGKSLLSNDEKTTIGILRMMDCGQNTAFDILDSKVNYTPKSIETLNKIIVLDKEGARKYLQNNKADLNLDDADIEKVLEYTHCNAPPAVYITSGDMIGKSGVWGHFGNWDFERAEIHKELGDAPKSEAIKTLTTKFNKSFTEANQIYADLHKLSDDNFITSWPSYMSSRIACSNLDDYYECRVPMQQNSVAVFKVDKITYETYAESNDKKIRYYPEKVVYYKDGNINSKDNSIVTNSSNLLPFGIILIPDQDRTSMTAMIASKEQADSTFTKLFFFNGQGMDCFKKLYEQDNPIGNDKVIVWNVDWECRQNNQYFEPIELVHAEHILISTDNRTESDAYKIASDLKDKLNATNFEQLAKEYSEDPSATINSGDLGWFKKGVMVQPFEDAAFDMSINETRIVKTQFGYHILKLIDKKYE